MAGELRRSQPITGLQFAGNVITTNFASSLFHSLPAIIDNATTHRKETVDLFSGVLPLLFVLSRMVRLLFFSSLSRANWIGPTERLALSQSYTSCDPVNVFLSNPALKTLPQISLFIQTYFPSPIHCTPPCNAYTMSLLNVRQPILSFQPPLVSQAVRQPPRWMLGQACCLASLAHLHPRWSRESPPQRRTPHLPPRPRPTLPHPCQQAPQSR
jgi:hypothetical protein